MATPQLSPGVLTREVDLTVGRAENVLDNIGGIAGPFAIGPVDDPIEVSTETDLINTFGKPISTDAQYEYWMTAASYLSYGGVLKVVRSNSENLNSANAGVGTTASQNLNIKNYDDYQANYTSATSFYYSAKTPGSWSNGLKVCYIDDLADQRIGIQTTSLLQAGAIIGQGVTAAITNTAIVGLGTTANFSGHLKGIITGVKTDTVNGNSTFDVKITARVSGVGTETKIDYKEKDPAASYLSTTPLWFVNSSGINTGTTGGGVAAAAFTPTEVNDWYSKQTLGLTNSTVFWSSIAPKPSTSNYVSTRNGKNDGIHIAIVDDFGTVSGIQGQILEKHTFLSKAEDAISAVNSPQKSYYKTHLADFSEQIYAGYNPSLAKDSVQTDSQGALVEPRATGFSTSFTPITTGNGQFGAKAQGVTFSSIGNVTYSLEKGEDYSAGVPALGDNGGFTATLGDLMGAYKLFKNKDEVAVDYLIMGPGLSKKTETQAKANYLISIAGERKDCVANVGPHRADIVNITNTTTQTDNLLQYFSPLSSSSYAIFDTGYKYTYDRFNNEFRYIPCNGDIAGLMTRTNLTSYPWFSPAGQQRGILNNVIKLAYNPTKAQRDQLYPNRINSVITQSGVGTLLFGDKTGLGYASAFDRINVRRLFLTIEQALQKAAEAQLFELNDELTRANFRNIVEPYLRDIEAKRGLYGFLVVCDTTNNTPDVIDNNEFRADIYLKPAKSINFVTLTFVATRTGVSFEEVAGRV